jgi:hypothetical protein
LTLTTAWAGPVLDACTRLEGRFRREREIVLGTDENAPSGMCFMPVTDPKTVKNRLHPDLTSSAHDREQQIERLLALGTPGQHRADRAESGTLLADPEGNEFCAFTG